MSKLQIRRCLIILAVLIGLIVIGVFACLLSFPVSSPRHPVPTPSLALAPPLPPDEVLEQYADEIAPLVEELRSDVRRRVCGSDLPPADETYIALIPLSERLYYVQEVLFPDLSFGSPEAQTQFYVAYDYARGTDLSAPPDGSNHIRYEVSAFSDLSPDTQEMYIEVYLFARTEDQLCVVEHLQESAGPGLSMPWDTRHRDLVKRALSVPKALGSYRAAIASVLNDMLCYATGIDYHESLALSRRLALVQWALSSPYWSDREQAAATLAMKGSDATPTMTALIQVMHEDERMIVRQTATRALSKIAPTSEQVIEALVYSVWHDPLPVAYSATYALGNSGEAAVPILIRVLVEHPDRYIRGAAVTAIADVGEAASTAQFTLVAMFDGESDDFTRMEIVRAIGNIGPAARESLPTLVRALNADSFALVRQEAARALSKVDDEGTVAIPALVRALSDEDVLFTAVYALKTYGPRAEEAVSALTEIVRGDLTARRTAVEALGEVGPAALDSVPVLIQLLAEDPDVQLARSIASALESITGETWGEDYSAWQQWWQAQ